MIPNSHTKSGEHVEHAQKPQVRSKENRIPGNNSRNDGSNQRNDDYGERNDFLSEGRRVVRHVDIVVFEVLSDNGSVDNLMTEYDECMTKTLLGVDIGGTNMKFASFDAMTRDIVRKQIVPTEAERGFSDVLERAVAVMETFRDEETQAIGVCVPGPVQQPEGTLLRAPNIPGSEGINLKKILEAKLRTSVAVGNDARCFALAEALLGAGKGHSVVCGITIGTGVGGGVIVNGSILGGAHGFAGEIGHMLLRPGEPPYATDDHRGTIEQFLSGTAFAERCKAASSPDDYLQGEACAFLHPEVFKEIAWLCTNVTHAYDPSIIVFGGSTGKALKPHLGAIEKELRKWLLPPTPPPVLAIAQREHAGALGAALLNQI